MSDDQIETDIAKFLGTKNDKPLVFFKTANVLQGTISNTVVERRKTTAHINKKTECGGFIVGNHWITKDANRKQVYIAHLVESLSDYELLILVREILQCDTKEIAQALYANNKKIAEMSSTIVQLKNSIEFMEQIVMDTCNRCISATDINCMKRICPLWVVSHKGSWRHL